jgi:hypothetical protein
LCEEIKEAWGNRRKPSDLGDVAGNLKGVMSSLHNWSSRTIGAIPKQIQKKRKALESASKKQDTASRLKAKKKQTRTR